MQPLICISGMPGAGKTHWLAALARQMPETRLAFDDTDPGAALDRARLGADLQSRLLPGLPDTGAPRTAPVLAEIPADHAIPAGEGTIVLAVADCVNLPALDPGSVAGRLAAAHFARADAILLSRPDLGDPTRTRAWFSDMTGAPIVEPGFDPTTLPPAAPPAPASMPDVTFPRWTYSGPATLTTDLAERLLADRPRGVTRIKGAVRLPRGGLELDLAGRARQTREIPAPSVSRLVALGPPDSFEAREMDLHFAEIAAAAAWSTGSFGYR